VFCEGLTMITGLEVGFGGAWVVAPPRLSSSPTRTATTSPTDRPSRCSTASATREATTSSTASPGGPDGWLYAGHGRTSISDLGRPARRRESGSTSTAGVWRYHPTRHVFEAWCDGTTNPWGVSFDDHGQAIITTCVDVHLYHAIQGAHFEPWRGRQNSLYAYGRIASIADHKHWVGTSYADARSARPEQLALGGGHAHCGAMVYLGDSFPTRTAAPSS
jgi:putative membrane-bound dehydrogenase-like protein